MRKLMVIVILGLILQIKLERVSAIDEGTLISTQQELYEWYLSDSLKCSFSQNITIDDDFKGCVLANLGFDETKNQKIVDTKDYSLIIDTDCTWNNPQLQIIGNSDHVLIWNNGYQEVNYIHISAQSGNALWINEDASFQFCESYGSTFPSYIVANKQAIINKSTSKYNSIYCAKIVSLQDQAFSSDNSMNINLSVIESYVPINYTGRLRNSCINGVWGEYRNGQWQASELDIEISEELEKIFVESYDEFDETLLPQTIEVNYIETPIVWDKSVIDFSQDKNTFTGTIQIMDEMRPFIDTSVSVDICIAKKSPILDFTVDDIEPRPENTYFPFFSSTKPIGYNEVFLEASLDNQKFVSIDVTWDVDCCYGDVVFFYISEFSSVPVDTDYYYRVRVVGGINEGISNTILVSHGEVFDVKDDTQAQEPVVPPDHDEDNILPDETDGNEGHRGDQNRDDVNDEKNEVVLKPEDIETMDKTDEDILIIINDKKASIPDIYIKEWKQQKETVTVSINDKNQVFYQVGKSASQVMENVDVENQNKSAQETLSIDNQKQIVMKKDFSKEIVLGVVMTVPLIIMGEITLYRRKKYDK